MEEAKQREAGGVPERIPGPHEVIIEIPTDLRNAPKSRDVKSQLSYLAKFAQLGIKLGKELLKNRGRNIAVIINNQADFKRVGSYAEMKSLYEGDDRPQDD